MTQSPQEPMNREMRRMSTKMGYDPENQRAQKKQAATKKRKAPGNDKLGVFTAIITFFKEAWKELKKVSWPTRSEVINSTIIVLFSLVLVTIIILVVDYGAEKLAHLVYS